MKGKKTYTAKISQTELTHINTALIDLAIEETQTKFSKKGRQGLNRMLRFFRPVINHASQKDDGVH